MQNHEFQKSSRHEITSTLPPFDVVAIARGPVRVSLATETKTHVLSGGPERVSLLQNWQARAGDPADAHLLGTGSLQLKPISGEVLSPLEHDSLPVAARGSDAERSFGTSISWLQPQFRHGSWHICNLGDILTANRSAANGADTAAWYWRKFVVSTADLRKKINLEISGNLDGSIVWFNGHCLGRMEPGSEAFRCDLSPFVILGGENTVVVRTLSSAAQGSGNVPAATPSAFLVKTGYLYIERSAGPISGRLRSGDRADLTFRATLQNDGWSARYGVLRWALLDPAGRALASQEVPMRIFGQDRRLFEHTMSLNDAAWLLDHPGKYFIQMTIIADGAICDESITPFDLRAVLCETLPFELLSRAC